MPSRRRLSIVLLWSREGGVTMQTSAREPRYGLVRSSILAGVVALGVVITIMNG